MTFLRPLLVSFGSLTLLTGMVYPAVLTGVARLVFPFQAGGSLHVIGGEIRGSKLIAQATRDPRYFWSRPSATSPFQTNAAASGGSFLAPSNPVLAQSIARQLQQLKDSDPGNPHAIPQDLVTTSASGLDPHISPDSAHWQMERIARQRNMDITRLKALVDRHVERGMGPARVNVLTLNLALDAASPR